MSAKKYTFFSFIFFVLFLNTTVFSQKIQNRLEKKRTQLQREIKKINTLLFHAKKQEKSLLNEINNLNHKVKVRSNLIKTLAFEKNILDTLISQNDKKTENLKLELIRLKKDYSQMIFKSYKSRSLQNRLLFLLSSENFYQAFKRFQYMKQYSNFRKEQGMKIMQKTQTLIQLNDSLKIKNKRKIFSLPFIKKKHKKYLQKSNSKNL